MFGHPRRIVATACLALGVLGGAAAAHAQVPSGKLVLYTSQPERDAAQTVAAFRKVHPGVEVDVFRSGTTEVMAKLAAEFSAGQPRPDVLLLADAATMEALKKDGRLLAYPQAKIDGIEPGASTPTARTSDRSSSRPVSRSTPPRRAVRRRGPISPGPTTRARSPCRARFTPAPPRSCSAR